MKQKIDGLGRKIRERRLELGWSQDYLAQATGYSRLYILKVENAQIKSPGIKALEKITHSLGITLESLW